MSNPATQAAQVAAAAGEDTLAKVLQGLSGRWGRLPPKSRRRLGRQVAVLRRAIQSKEDALQEMRDTLNQGQQFDFGRVRETAQIYCVATTAFWGALAGVSANRELVSRLPVLQAHAEAKRRNWERICDEAEADLGEAAEAGAQIYAELGLV